MKITNTTPNALKNLVKERNEARRIATTAKIAFVLRIIGTLGLIALTVVLARATFARPFSGPSLLLGSGTLITAAPIPAMASWTKENFSTIIKNGKALEKTEKVIKKIKQQQRLNASLERHVPGILAILRDVRSAHPNLHENP